MSIFAAENGEIWLLATTQKNAKMTLHAWCVHPNF